MLVVTPDSRDVTDLLHALQAGDTRALDQLLPIIYDELRVMAARYLSRSDGTPTLQPTALVHELYFRLVDQRNATWHNRAQFFATAAIMMRRLIVDHVRKHAAEKRGGGRLVQLEEGLERTIERPEAVLRVHEALEVLATVDARQAQVVELRFFGGLSNEETAEALGVSPTTIKRDWALARAWLRTELRG